MAIAGESLRANVLLAALPEDERRAVAAVAERVDFDTRTVIYESGQPLDRVVFPIDVVCSLLSAIEEDRSIEIGTVGREGFVGVAVLLQGGYTSEHRAIAQVGGEALQLPVGEFQQLLDDLPTLRTMLLRYTLALLAQIAQSSACNRLHPLEQRCARWLLMTQDRKSVV